MIRRFAVVAALTFLSAASTAATITWTGAVNGNWSNAGNWDLGRAPINGDEVVVPASATFPSNYDLAGVTLLSISFQAASGNTPLNGGQISIQAGGLFLDGTAGLDIHTPIAANGPMIFRPSSTDLFGVLSGTGPVNFELCGNFVLNAVNTYSGATTVGDYVGCSGNLFAVVTGAIPATSALTVNAPATVHLQATTTVASIAGTGGIRLYSGAQLTAGDSGSTVFSGPISQSAGTGSFVKAGSGTLTLVGASTYTGATTVSAGRLDVTGSLQSPTTLNSGATLGGTGTINSSVTVNAGATLAPGVSPGILNTGNLSLAAGGLLQIELNGTAVGAQYDQVNVTGTVSLGGATLGVTLGYAPASGDTFTIIQNDGADPVTGTFAGLAEGAMSTFGGVMFQVSYVGGDGNDVTLTALTVPGAPTIGVATPGNGQATIAFTPGATGGSPITGYTMTCNPGAITGSGAGSPITVTGLANGTTYTCSVTATNAVGTSSPSGTVTVTPRDVPGAPTIGIATPGNGQATIAFTPGATGGSPITGYTMTCNPGAITGSGAGSPITVAGLANGTTYTCSVTATNAAGTSIPSSTVTVTPFTVPGAPTIGSATPGNAQATIAFTAPASTGGSAITGYTVTCTPSGTASGAASPLTVTGLANGTTYTCSVSATNAAGTSAASGTVTVTPSFNVFSGPSATGTGTITASFTGGGAACAFSAPAFIAAPPGSPPVPPTAPNGGITFLHGLFDFRAVGCTAGSTLSFTIVYPAALPPSTAYFKYGPTAGDPTPHWYILPATISGNTATFTITDGGLGDDDLAANGTIVDQGGPGVFPPGAGVQQTPTLSEWAMILMTLLVAMTGAASVRRRRPR